MKLRLTLLLVLSIAAVFAGCGGGEPLPGKPAPDFQLPSLDQQTISLSEFRGSPLLVNFWATWCGPCVHEMPYLQQIWDDWQAMGLVLLAINIDESPAEVVAFVQTYGFSFPVLLDSQGRVARQYGIRGIPTTFFIDQEGIICEVKLGAFRSTAEIEKSLGKLFD